jgi:chaperonin GroES
MKKKTAKKTTKKILKLAVIKKPGIVPLSDRVLIRPFMAEEPEIKNSFGLIIPETVKKERPEHGEVLAVGEGRYEDGKLIPVKVKVGDTVLFSKYGFEDVVYEGKELYILKEENILAIIKN